MRRCHEKGIRGSEGNWGGRKSGGRKYSERMTVIPFMDFPFAARTAKIFPHLFVTEQTGPPSSDQNKEGVARRVAMGAIGGVFQPELIELMKTILDDAAATFPEAKRTSTLKAEIAAHILACAAKGERDPGVLKMSALLAVVECTHYSHDISPERRAV